MPDDTSPSANTTANGRGRGRPRLSASGVAGDNAKNGNAAATSPSRERENPRTTKQRTPSDSMIRRKGGHNSEETDEHDESREDGNNSASGSKGEDGGDGGAGAGGSSSATGQHSSPKKRRKVNHACVYCRRSHMTCDSERPCSRCIKRNIGHLCHDEPRDQAKRNRGENDEDGVANGNELSNSQTILTDAAGQQLPVNTSPSMAPPNTLDASSQPLYYNDWPMNGQNQFQDIHPLHPSYMFNAPEVTHEYNLLGDFLSNSLLDDGALFQGEEPQGLYSDSSSLLNSMAAPFAVNTGNFMQPPQPPQQQAQFMSVPQTRTPQVNSVQRQTSTVGTDKAQETYYMTAADPSGMDPPEERMNRLLKAKYDAGLLKPFNYVKGYARLNQYMEEHMQPALRQKILRQLDKFRPKFRERMQSLTDVELILVEMWFERSLMEYDRVFASMAIPACCWRRTGEIFRGNKEMAELIDVPIENLRDGKLAIHQIITEDQLVSYWEKFGAIAFDSTQKAMLTSCTLKSPNDENPGPSIPCCFSFTIRRDPHNIPALIVGNFLPLQRKK